MTQRVPLQDPAHTQVQAPVVFDFDASVLPLTVQAEAENAALSEAGEVRIPLEDWQEAIRFGCTWSDFARLEAFLDLHMPALCDCVFTGSGDYHHLSLYLLRRLAAVRQLPRESFDLVVCDNHPDNMRYPFGLHCGSWISHASKLPAVRHVHVVGISSPDINAAHAVENRLAPFMSGKLTYWSINSSARWLRFFGRGARARRYTTADALLEDFLPVLHESGQVYLSIDKDVFSPRVVRTNWDQGLFDYSHMERIIGECRGRLLAADVTGDVSEYIYKGWLKRFLSRMDGQRDLAPEEVRAWQQAQQKVNLSLLERLNAAFVS